jgi:hypothetical protein
MPSTRASVAIAALAVLVARGAAAQPPPPGSQPGSDQPVDPYAAPPADEREAPRGPGSVAPENEAGPNSGLGDEDDVDAEVAQALYRRGVALYRRGAAAEAKMLFIESLERSPRGRVSADALRMLRAANRRLGIANLDHGRPSAQGQEGVLDPYAGGGGAPAPSEAPLDPYGAAPTPEPPDAMAPVEPVGPDDRAEPEQGSAMGRRAVIGWSGAVGLVAGLALGGPEDDSGELADAAIVAGLVGAAGGVGLSYWLTRRVPLTVGQSAAIASAATWGATQGGLLADATTGTDSEANDVWKYVAAGGLIGLGGGVVYARMGDPSEQDIALTNSLALMGTGLGLSIAAGMEVAESEAFSLNALFGSTAGLAAGLLLSPRVEVSLRRSLLLDLGAAAGAAAGWAVLYPLIYDDTTRDDEQVVGWVSTATLTGGVIAMWYLTRNMDAASSGQLAAPRRGPPAPPGLARLEADGDWHLGVPFLRPLRSPALAPAGETALGIDLVSGRF